jgi:hypothetical protein
VVLSLLPSPTPTRAHGPVPCSVVCSFCCYPHPPPVVVAAPYCFYRLHSPRAVQSPPSLLRHAVHSSPFAFAFLRLRSDVRNMFLSLCSAGRIRMPLRARDPHRVDAYPPCFTRKSLLPPEPPGQSPCPFLFLFASCLAKAVYRHSHRACVL